ncbi:MAG: T9SS type A sorting domain-containing protein [Bacteroidia bacterium]|nr:T9SS type A sorting domain-containing protein [Bacteroidia bacterium]
MKQLYILAALLLGLNLGVRAQSVITVSGDISANTTWTSNNIYLLSGFVYVTNNAELTIEPGTVIKGDKATKGSLIITRGSKIWADGTSSAPIVFTSNEPVGTRTYGDWGGLIVLGKASINDPAGEKVIEGGVDPVKGLYGGTDDADNSGTLRYVRIEFPGIAFQPNNEINGLTLGGVGNGTTIDYVMVSFSGDDAFECFGGTVNAKHLISYRTLDDDFDTDFGFRGKMQFLVALRDSNVADVSGSNGFESDNDATGSTNNPLTQPIYSNVTIIGPMATASTQINSNFKRGSHLRRSCKTSIFNSAIAGFPTGLLVDGANCEANATNNELQYQHNVLAGCATPLAVASGSSWDISAWFTTPAYGNEQLTNSSDLQLMDPNNYANPDFMPSAGSPLLSGADFSSNYLNDPFFESVSYRGAFGNSDWTNGWANYDCENTNYTVGISEINSIRSISAYPNPAHRFAVVSFSLEQASDLSVSVIDLEGREVISLQPERYLAGEHRIELNVEALAQGIYTLVMRNESAITTLRLAVN